MNIETVTSPSRKFFKMETRDGHQRYEEGCKAVVTLTTERGREVFIKEFNDEPTFQKFVARYIISFPGYSLFKASFIPMRLENCEDVGKFVLFPTLINHAIKADGCAKKALYSLVGLSWDLLTLTPRLALTPFRMGYNHNAQRMNHPLSEIFRDDREADTALKTERLVAHMETRTVQIEEGIPRVGAWIDGRPLFSTAPIKASIKETEISRPINTNHYWLPPICEESATTQKTKKLVGDKFLKTGDLCISESMTSSTKFVNTNYNICAIT